MAKVNYLTRGNKKLAKSILGWSITPIKSCLNCDDCKKSCYALKSYRLYPAVKQAWNRNLELAKTGEFKECIIDQLSRVRKVSAVRIHVAGDFFSQEYINHWAEIAKTYPEIPFYSYSKVMHLFDFSPLLNLANVNIINSIAEDGKINFGDDNRVKELESMGYTLCPATVKDDVICGKDCEMCQYINKVCFKIH